MGQLPCCVAFEMLRTSYMYFLSAVVPAHAFPRPCNCWFGHVACADGTAVMAPGRPVNLVSYHYLSGWHALARCGSGAIAAAWSKLLTDHNASS
jgi:hypothetical protein